MGFEEEKLNNRDTVFRNNSDFQCFLKIYTINKMLYISIILTWMIFCVSGRPLPCPIVDERTGAMLCCNYHKPSHGEGETNQFLESDKKCTLLTPKSSLGLLKEVWSMKNYTWATGMLTTTLSETKDIPRLKDCCYEEIFNFSISSHGVSAQTGETCKIVQQEEYVQPVLNLLCVKKDTCQNSGTFQIFQKLEVRSLYVEAQDHPEHVHQELVLMPSGCLCAPNTQIVKPDGGTFLIPMNLVDEANSDSNIVKRNIEYPTDLPEILRLALEIMREPNPLPVLNAIERQMALQVQHTRYLTAIAMATGVRGGLSHEQGLSYEPDHWENITQTDMESLPVASPQKAYHLILSAFLAGLSAGQNVENITQIEILDRLIVDNGDSGMNLLETILELQNTHDLNSLDKTTNVDSDDISSDATPPTFLIDDTTKGTANDFATAMIDSTTETVISTSSEGDSTPSATMVFSTTEDGPPNSSDVKIFIGSYDSKKESIEDTTVNTESTTVNTESIEDTVNTESTKYTTVNTESIEDTTVNTESIEDTTVDTESIAYTIDNNESNEDTTVNTEINEDTSVKTDSIAYTTIDTSSNKDYTTDPATMVDGSPDPTVLTASNEDYTTESPTMVGSTADFFFETTPNELYVPPPPESIIEETVPPSPATAFNLTEYIMELPQYKPITIDPDYLMHIMFASHLSINDERANS